MCTSLTVQLDMDEVGNIVGGVTMLTYRDLVEDVKEFFCGVFMRLFSLFFHFRFAFCSPGPQTQV